MTEVFFVSPWFCTLIINCNKLGERVISYKMYLMVLVNFPFASEIDDLWKSVFAGLRVACTCAEFYISKLSLRLLCFCALLVFGFVLRTNFVQDVGKRCKVFYVSKKWLLVLIYLYDVSVTSITLLEIEARYNWCCPHSPTVKYVLKFQIIPVATGWCYKRQCM